MQSDGKSTEAADSTASSNAELKAAPNEDTTTSTTLPPDSSLDAHAKNESSEAEKGLSHRGDGVRENDNAEQTSEADPFDVYWDEPVDQDPANPMNWRSARKTAIIVTVSFLTFLTSVNLSIQGVYAF